MIPLASRQSPGARISWDKALQCAMQVDYNPFRESTQCFSGEEQLSTELKIIEENDEFTRVAIVGRLDIAGVQAIELKFISHVTSSDKPMILDLSEVPYLSSIGIRMLMGSAKTLKKAGAKMVALRPPEMTEEILKSAGLHQVFSIVHDENRALEIVRAK